MTITQNTRTDLNPATVALLEMAEAGQCTCDECMGIESWCDCYDCTGIPDWEDEAEYWAEYEEAQRPFGEFMFGPPTDEDFED